MEQSANSKRSLEAVVGELLKRRQLTLSTAESCTGGLIGQRLTAISGSSAYYVGGVIAYSNSVKVDLLDVPQVLLDQYGAVSAPVAEAMAEGVLARMSAHVSLSTTGIAGPASDSSDKPVGLVYIGLAARGLRTFSREFHFDGNRDAIRMATSHSALEMLKDYLSI